jgi:hypothetical protein
MISVSRERCALMPAQMAVSTDAMLEIRIAKEVDRI